MKKKKKRIRLRWGRIAAALSVLAAIVVAIYFLILGLISLFHYIFDDKEKAMEETEMQIELTPEMMYCDSVMAHKLDSFLHVPQRLDTNNIAICVFDATTQLPIFAYNEDESVVPASCMKLATAITALKTLGMNYRYEEHLLAKGEMKRDTLVGTLQLSASDDPLFLSFDSLIVMMKQRGIHHVRGNVTVNLAREDTLRAHPTAKTWDIPYRKTPLLMRGKKYIERTFLASLHAKGVTIRKDSTVNPQLAKGKLGGGKYHKVASTSHLLRDVLTPMLIHSSNVKADAVFYHLNWKAGLYPDRRIHWEVPNVVDSYMNNIPTETADIDNIIKVYDGSGLSPDNRLTARFLVDLLRFAYRDKELHDYFIDEGLASPASGARCGSLTTRMSRPEYKGRLFCKTGTMTTIGTSSLAGYIIGSDGHWYIFSIVNSDSPVYESRMFQDRMCKMMMK